MVLIFLLIVFAFVHMHVLGTFDEIPLMILHDIKETKCYGHTFVRAHEKTFVEYTWNSVRRLPHTHPPSKFLRFIVNENHNGINLICIFKGNTNVKNTI